MQNTAARRGEKTNMANIGPHWLKGQTLLLCKEFWALALKTECMQKLAFWVFWLSPFPSWSRAWECPQDWQMPVPLRALSLPHTGRRAGGTSKCWARLGELRLPRLEANWQRQSPVLDVCLAGCQPLGCGDLCSMAHRSWTPSILLPSEQDTEAQAGDEHWPWGQPGPWAQWNRMTSCSDLAVCPKPREREKAARGDGDAKTHNCTPERGLEDGDLFV